MRLLLISCSLFFISVIKAQTYLPGNNIARLQQQSLMGNNFMQDSVADKKWTVTKYVGMSTSFGFSNRGNFTMFAVPVGIQLNRKLSNNWYAFAGVNVAPAYINANPSFLPVSNKFAQGNQFNSPGRLNMYSRAELGLMYVNDQKTFSISGSIGVERSSYPMVPFNHPATLRPATMMVPNR